MVREDYFGFEKGEDVGEDTASSAQRRVLVGSCTQQAPKKRNKVNLCQGSLVFVGLNDAKTVFTDIVKWLTGENKRSGLDGA